MFLKALRIQKSESACFPFDIPLFQTLETISFDKPVTFFVGENGTGKSTLLEGIAAATGSIAVGAEDIKTDPTLAHARTLAKQMTLSWRLKTRKGFFLRAEDFLNFSRKIKSIREEMKRNLEEVEIEYKDRSLFAQGQARMPYLRSIAEMERNYGADLDARSHGESFLKLFHARFVPGGLYLLDEPETPLSPMKQLSFISMMKEMVAQNCQFIIATHSPILMAFPDAAIWSFDSAPIARLSYEELEHVNLTRDFLTNPERFLRHL